MWTRNVDLFTGYYKKRCFWWTECHNSQCNLAFLAFILSYENNKCSCTRKINSHPNKYSLIKNLFDILILQFQITDKGLQVFAPGLPRCLASTKFSIKFYSEKKVYFSYISVDRTWMWSYSICYKRIKDNIVVIL